MILGRILVILALFSLSGLDRSLLQSYAWSTMLRDRTPEMGLSKALDSTFSGEQPCEICLAIIEAAQQEQEEQPVGSASDPKPKLFSAHVSIRPIVVTPPSASISLPGFCGPADRSIVLELPTPPPRWV